MREFKAVDYDLSKWNGVVDAFEGKAVAAAKETLAKISKEEGSLKETLSNIQEARPFEDLTVSLVISAWQGGAREMSNLPSMTNNQVDEVGKARPEITKATETMIKKGKWTVPGYRVSFSIGQIRVIGS